MKREKPIPYSITSKALEPTEAELKAHWPLGYDGPSKTEIEDYERDSRSFAAAAAALGRSPDTVAANNTGTLHRGGPQAGTKLRCDHVWKDGLCIRCYEGEPTKCRACDTLRTRYRDVAREYAAECQKFFRSYASVSYGGVKAFEQSVAPLLARLKSAKAAYEKHVAKTVHR